MKYRLPKLQLLTNFVRVQSDSRWTIYLAIFPHLVIQLKAVILSHLLLDELQHFCLCYFLSASGDDLLGNLYDDLPTSENSGENKRKLETDRDDNESPAKRILAGEEIILLQLLLNCRLNNVKAMHQIYRAKMNES